MKLVFEQTCAFRLQTQTGDKLQMHFVQLAVYEMFI